jgi:hypothetical protein
VYGRWAGGRYVSYVAGIRAAYVVPDTLYAAETWHGVVVSDQVTDEAENPLAPADTSSFRTGPLDCDHLTDLMEPNGTTENAALVETDRPYHTLSICEDDMDNFLVDLQDTTRIDFRISIRHAVDEWSALTLMRDDEGEQFFTRAWPTTQTGEEHTVSFSFLPGTFRYRYSSAGSADLILYDIELETGDPCRDDIFEDNDWYGSNVVIGAGSYADMRGCPEDSDIFVVELGEGDLLIFTVTTATDPTERRMGIYSPANAELAVYTGEDNPSSVQATAPEAGAHTIFVLFDSEEPIDYEMTVSVEY